MSKFSVVVYNHDEPPAPWVTRVDRAAQHLGGSCTDVAKEHDDDTDIKAANKVLTSLADISIVHVTQSAWDLLTKESMSGRVYIRTSTAGLRQQPEKTESGAYLLALRSSHEDLELKDWQSVLEAVRNPDTLENIVTNRASAAVRQYFAQNTSFEIRPALTILCQGYLAVCSASSVAEGRLVDGVVRKALEHMRWEDVLREKKLPPDLHMKLQEIQSPVHWWDVFGLFDASGRLSTKHWEKTWSDASIEFGVGGIPPSVAQLLKQIHDSKPISDADLVAAAYLELVKST